jgi:hypothetical protein
MGFLTWAIIYKKFLFKSLPCLKLLFFYSGRIRDYSGLGQDLTLQVYEFKIPDDFKIPTEHRAKFQLSRCMGDRKIGDRRTEDITISKEHNIFKMCS